MPLAFDRPIGAPADCQELEYCVALLQTCADVDWRMDATVAAVDLQRLLTSRHGLLAQLPVRKIRNDILVGLAGCVDDDDVVDATKTDDGDDDQQGKEQVEDFANEDEGGDKESTSSSPNDEGDADDEEACMLDLVQLTALLMIPELLRSRNAMQAEQQQKLNNETADDDDSDDSSSNSSSFSFKSAKQSSTSSSSSTTATQPHQSWIQIVLDFMLEQAAVEPGTVLTVEVLRAILQAYGEDAIWPQSTLQEMVDCCRQQCDDSATDKRCHSELPILTADIFLRALTYDTIEHYPLQRETLESTHYQDARAPIIRSAEQDDNDDSGCTSKNDLSALMRMYTAPSIDNTADTYRSFWWSILAWMTLAAIFISYLVDGLSLHQTLPRVDCTTNTRLSDFGCAVIEGVVVWIEIFLELSILGTTFVFLSTLGNSAYAHDASSSKWFSVVANCVSIVLVVFCTILAFHYSVETPLFSTEKSDDSYAAYFASLILGCLLMIVLVAQLVKILFPLDRYPRMRPYFASGILKMERWTKLATKYKVQRMIENALTCHIVEDDDDCEEKEEDCDLENNKEYRVESCRIRSPTSRLLSKSGSSFANEKTRHGPMSEALLTFHAQSDCTVSVGGLLWCWKGILVNRKLLRDEGIWIFPRLIYTNLGQWFVCILIPVFLAIAVRWVSNNESNLNSWNIKKREVNIALAFGALLALAACLGISLLYIPSAVSTLLRFRSGFMPSLRDPSFLVYRKSPDLTTLLFGSAFWGAIFTGIVCWFVVGLVVFLIVWEQFRDILRIILANIIGFLVTLSLKMLVLCIVRKRWYNAFYRTSPVGANFTNLILECWNLGLSVGCILIRLARILALSIFYIGRIDTPLLAPGVGWIFGRIPPDSYPLSFRKDLLIHDAHRHPYIERLSLLSMLKLRHGTAFGQRAGAAWRILFVLALMPWLRKYRQQLPKQRRKPGQLASPMSSNHDSTTTATDLWTQKHALEVQVQLLQRENNALRKKMAGDGDVKNRRRSSISPMQPGSSSRRRPTWFQEQTERFLLLNKQQPSTRRRPTLFRKSKEKRPINDRYDV